MVNSCYVMILFGGCGIIVPGGVVMGPGRGDASKDDVLEDSTALAAVVNLRGRAEDENTVRRRRMMSSNGGCLYLLIDTKRQN